MKACSIIDAPSDLGLRRTGVDGLPAALRDAGLLEGIPGAQYAGRIAVPEYVPLRDESTGIMNSEGLITFAGRLADRVAFTLDFDRFPVVLGGDCSILLGCALALKRRGRFGLFFMDGHADFYSPEAEPNGEAASMDLALVVGHGPDALTNLEGRRPLVREEDAIVYGFRDAETATEYGSPDVRETAVHAFELAEVRRQGAAPAAREGLALLEKNAVDGVWIHLDADVLNDEVMPAVDYRVPGGLWPEELSEALSVVLRSPLAVGMDITIYNPTLDDPDRSAARVLAQTVTSAWAATR